MYVEDWGEGLVGKSAPVLCVADLSKGDVTMCPGVPRHVSPGQVNHYFYLLYCLLCHLTASLQDEPFSPTQPYSDVNTHLLSLSCYH